jgi:hypothetical protein
LKSLVRPLTPRMVTKVFITWICLLYGDFHYSPFVIWYDTNTGADVQNIQDKSQGYSVAIAVQQQDEEDK